MPRLRGFSEFNQIHPVFDLPHTREVRRYLKIEIISEQNLHVLYQGYDTGIHNPKLLVTMQVPIGLGSNAIIKVVAGKTEKVFTDLYKAKAYYVRQFKSGKEPKIVRISEREKPLPTISQNRGE